MLADAIEDVIGELRLDGKRRGRSFVAFCPWDGQREPKLHIDVRHKPGAWINFKGGEKGDALDLVAAVLTDGRTDGHARGRAMKWARAFLKIEGVIDQADFQRRAAEAEARRVKRAAQYARELGDKRRTAKGLWLAARPLSPGDGAWRYLAARGVDLAKLPRLPRAVRYSAEQRWHDGDTGEVTHVGPALMSAMTLASGAFASLHRIWIDPDRPGQKADLPEPRKMWPDSEGAAIRLWRGESGLAEKDAEQRGLIEDVVLCEGVEDGLSIALMTPELRIHAVGSLPGLLSYTPAKIVRRLIVAADNDWGKPQAQRMLDRATARLRDFNKIVAIARSPEGKDFNDLLRGV